MDELEDKQNENTKEPKDKNVGVGRSVALQQMLLSGFSGSESLSALRERLGIDADLWESWLRDGRLPGDMVRLSRGMAEMTAPWVWSSLLRQTDEGSIPAIKLFFELCGKEEQRGMGESGSLENREIADLRRELFGMRTPAVPGENA